MTFLHILKFSLVYSERRPASREAPLLLKSFPRFSGRNKSMFSIKIAASKKLFKGCVWQRCVLSVEDNSSPDLDSRTLPPHGPSPSTPKSRTGPSSAPPRCFSLDLVLLSSLLALPLCRQQRLHPGCGGGDMCLPRPPPWRQAGQRAVPATPC